MCKKSDYQTLYGVVMAKSLAGFRQELRLHVRRYWKSEFDKNSFVRAFQNSIKWGFRRAFRQGAAECGVREKDYSDDTIAVLQSKIDEQFPFVVDFVDTIVTRKDGGKLADAFRKIELWVARYGEVVNLAKGVACGEENLRWVLGVAEHCSSCKRLHGIVKPASFWNNRGILPRVPGANYLICRGYNCKCAFQLTDDPITKGPFPKLP